MKNSNDSIRQENKKAIPKFILISVLALIGGGILGVALVFLNLGNFGEALAAAGVSFTINAAPWLLVALPVVELAACLPIYFGAKKQLAVWDGEDENVSGAIEIKLSVCLWITSAATMRLTPVKFFGGMAAFLVTLYLSAVLQQKVVDATKQMNPEKHGSVYDTRFQKKWLESCDEAERAVIGQCALKSYQAMCHACLALWAIFALGGMFFSWGFMPAMTVCIVWGVGQSVYSYSCIKLSKPGSPQVL